VAKFELKVMFIGSGLNFSSFTWMTSGVSGPRGFAWLAVFVFAIIHDPANRRSGVGRNFHQVRPCSSAILIASLSGRIPPACRRVMTRTSGARIPQLMPTVSLAIRFTPYNCFFFYFLDELLHFQTAQGLSGACPRAIISCLTSRSPITTM